MPLLRSAARRATRKDEGLPLLDRNGGAEDTASGDDLVAEMGDMHHSAGSEVIGLSRPPSRLREGGPQSPMR